VQKVLLQFISLELFIVYVAFSHVLSATENFIPYVYGTKNGAENRRQKKKSIYGAGFWIVCHGR